MKISRGVVKGGMLCLFMVSAVTLLWCPVGRAGELQGAQALIAKIEQGLAAGKEGAAGGADQGERGKLKNDLKQFPQVSKALSPEDAAKEWLMLLDRYFLLPRTGIGGVWQDPRSELNVSSVLDVLPGPESWDHLTGQVALRSAIEDDGKVRNVGLKLLFCLLNGEPEKAQGLIDAFQKDSSGLMDGYRYSSVTNQLEEIGRLFKGQMEAREAKGVLPLFMESLKKLKESRKTGTSLKVPDLVALAGPEKAAELLSEAFRLPGVEITVPGGGETLKLARSQIIKDIDNIPTPHWGLVNSVDALPLFEALQKKFPSGKMSEAVSSTFVDNEGYDSQQYQAAQARSYYILALVAAGRNKEAADLLQAQERSELESYNLNGLLFGENNVGLPLALFQFYEEIMKSITPFPFWKQYIELAITLGKTEEALKKLEATVDMKSLGVKDRFLIDGLRITACLAADAVDQAAAIMIANLEREVPKESGPLQTEIAGLRLFMAQTLFRLGCLYQNNEWREKGLAALKSPLDSGLPLEQSGYSPGLYSSVVEYLVEQKRFDEAEALVVEVMLKQAQALRNIPGFNLEMLNGQPIFESDLSTLLYIYDKAGRAADVIYVLEHAPWFQGADLKKLGDGGIVKIACRALHTLGRNAEAVDILKDYLNQNPSDDGAYEILLESASEDLIPWLDGLYAMDRFEERPLIWKAVVLLRKQLLAEAEKVIREALKVDPTDGEQQKGDRVRAYQVLADILAAKGDQENADFFRKVVSSVRLAETGDEYTELGLIKRSISYYEQAEKQFADAYCVQWRLAERLYAIGKQAEAEKHYRIVFERMPEQFGQVASFCFGCEGVFQRPHSRSIAEEVLTHVEQAGVKRPQVYYLLGQLRESEGRSQEAYGYFRKALAMDPDYLDVWGHVYALQDDLFLPASEAEETSFKILALDPLQKHRSVDFNKITNIKKLWSVLSANQNLRRPEADHWFTLTASKALLEERAKSAPSSAFSMQESMSPWADRGSWTPGRYLMQNRIFSSIVEMIDGR